MCGQVTEHMAGRLAYVIVRRVWQHLYGVSSLLLLLLAVPQTFVPTQIYHFRVVLQKSLS
jgi:hypothetical protein